MTVTVHIKRAYDAAADDDGFRVLVDRLWPRGLSKATLKYDKWYKELAPSSALRTWFGHKPERWDQFRREYTAELQGAPQQHLMGEILSEAANREITLVYSAHDTERNQAVVIASELQAYAQRHPA